MAFEAAEPRVLTNIGEIRVVLIDRPNAVEGEEESEAVEYSIKLLDANGNEMERKRGDLVPHLSSARITSLRAFMADVRTKAQALIPE